MSVIVVLGWSALVWLVGSLAYTGFWLVRWAVAAIPHRDFNKEDR